MTTFGGDGDRGGDVRSSNVWIPTQVDEQKATSGKIGCAPGEITIEDVDDEEGTRSWTATCAGRSYFCSYDLGNTSCSPQGGSEGGKDVPADTSVPRRVVRSARPPNVPAPKGAAGFRFGTSLDACRATCEEAGHTFENAEGRARCSGTPESIGLSATVQLGFCGDRLCTIEIAARPPDDDSAVRVDTFARLSSALEEKYGKSNVESRLVPERCRAVLADCLQKGDAELVYDWTWSRSVGVALAMDNHAGEPAIRLSYRRQAALQKAPAVIKANAL
jgi:hypothetical protein